jgi:chromosome segregation ATPase
MKDDATLKEGYNLEESKTSSEIESRVKELEKDLARKESEIEFLKEKLNNNQEVLLDIIEDKKLLKKQIEEFELKEIEEKLNNFRKLQHKHHKTEHRLYITKKNLDTARQDLEERRNVIVDLEKRGLRDYVLGNYPESYVKYQKKNID